MLIQILACFLIAAGALLFAWCLFGYFLLPFGSSNLQLILRVCDDAPHLEQQLRALSWLRHSSLLRGELTILDCGLNEEGRSLVDKLAAKYVFIFEF